ncbi:MAG: hypothetical protein AAGJ78_01815 [Pseudomonadota bacterium]
MHRLTSVNEFFADESGLTVVEYVVGAGLMVIVFTGVFAAFSDSLTSELDTIF